MISCSYCFLPSLGLRKDHLETLKPKPLEPQQKCGRHSQESPSGVPSYWPNAESEVTVNNDTHTGDHSTVPPVVKTCKHAGANGSYARKSGITRMQLQACSILCGRHSVPEGRKVNRECHFISPSLTSASHFLLWGIYYLWSLSS